VPYSISLSNNEQRLAKFIARSRYENARTNNIQDVKISNQSNEEIDLEGFGAELAYCKLMNLYPDLETGGSLPNFDCISRYGATIDVKTTKYKKGHLLATLKKKNNPPDKYVLIVGEFPNYQIVGEIGSDEFLQDNNIKNLGRGRGYALSQIKLNSITI
jgi:hypothetical protein|tara:strand:+ start:147 stop:623 length:477 start_codon:yes stop_codon:yes gene_type:complete